MLRILLTLLFAITVFSLFWFIDSLKTHKNYAKLLDKHNEKEEDWLFKRRK